MKPLLGVTIAVTAILLAGSVSGQAGYPEKPMRIIVGFPPGNSLDAVARLLGQKLAEAWTKPVITENVPGAAGNIAADRVAKATPDGYTLGLLSQTQLVVNPSLYRLPYDPVTDFAPISQVTLSPILLVVHNAVPANSVKELVVLARARPDELTFASGGNGSGTHMPAELFKFAANVDVRHIPYKGVVAAIPDLLGGRVTMMFSPIGTVLPSTREGKLRALAVTSSRRSLAAPELPTFAESGYPGFEYTLWFGLIAPARTPAVVVKKLHSVTVKALALPDLRAKLLDLGLEEIGNSPDEFAVVIKNGMPKWAKIIKDAGIRPD